MRNAAEGNRALAALAAQNAESDRIELEYDLSWLLSDARGRRVLRYIQRMSAMEQPQEVESETVFAYGAGRREIGLKFTQACKAVNSQLVIEAASEEAEKVDRRRDDREHLLTINKQKKGEQ